MALYWTAFIMGIVGNFHCLGMCGPIALAVPIKRDSTATKILSIFLYNGGRIMIYSFFGILFGMFGRGIFLAGFQQVLSIILGSVIVLGVLFPYIGMKFNMLKSPIFMQVGKLKNAFHRQFKKTGYRSIFTIGMLNGLLPCGLVFMALAGAIASGTWQSGMIYMMLFGIGTLPVMVALPYFGASIDQNLRRKFNKIVPIVLFLFGVLLILRGSNLGIPYVSPLIENSATGSSVICH